MFVLVNLGFVLQVACLYWLQSVDEIKKNWNAYRCNPMYMPLSDNIRDDFTYCVQNSQKDMMGYLLQPLTYITGALTDAGAQMSGDINGLRGMLSTVRDFVAGIVDQVMGVFLNLIIEFQRIVIGIKDIVGKLVGSMMVLMYIMDGSVKTMQSAVAGPPGQLVTALSSSHCFAPATYVQLLDGRIQYMGDLSPGAQLADGSVVRAVMRVVNDNTESVYSLPGGVMGEPVHVTGSHLVWDPASGGGTYVRVRDLEGVIETLDADVPHFVCLITDTHHIRLGEQLFWDWEDHLAPTATTVHEKCD